MKFIQSVLAVALFSSVATNANATVYRFSFSNTSTEYVQSNGGVSNPSSIFAYLDYDDVLQQFRLYDNTSDNYLINSGNNSNRLAITGIAFNFNATVPNAGTVSYPSSSYDSGSMTGLTSNNVPNAISGAGFDRTYTTNQRLVNGESETFAISTFNNTAFSNLMSSGGNVLASSIAVRVSNNSDDNQRISWFTASSVAAVPEPETYAMFLAGLGLLGFASRRKTAA